MEIIYIEKKLLKKYFCDFSENTQSAKNWLKNSILQHGLVLPLIINSENFVIDGHARLDAIQEIQEIEKVPCIIAKFDFFEAFAFAFASKKSSSNLQYLTAAEKISGFLETKTKKEICEKFNINKETLARLCSKSLFSRYKNQEYSESWQVL